MKTHNNNEFKKGKSIIINVQDSPVKITFAAERNEKLVDMIKATLLNAYSANIVYQHNVRTMPK